ncbi:MAG: hypothetical protein JJU11_00370, partial [Candidatus Sumerlaeia bacterium]|nr:hypothetical protein [Candidatus Sumerlaeia bacterium]
MASTNIPANLRFPLPLNTYRCHTAPLIALLTACLFIAGCVGRHTADGATTRSRTLPSFPVILWVDWSGCADKFSGDPSAAMEFCRQARQAGVTHLALEARTHDGYDALGENGVHSGAELNIRRA